MENENIQAELLEQLPIIELDNKFMELDYFHKDLEHLIGKDIVFEKILNDGYVEINEGKLVDYVDNKLLIKEYNYANVNEDLLSNEWIDLKDIRGIEEFKCYNNLPVSLNNLKTNNIIRITNYKKLSIDVLYIDSDEMEITFIAKVNNNGNIEYNTLTYYKNFIDKIEIIK